MTIAEVFRRRRLLGLIVPLAAGIVTVIGAISDPTAFFAAWLAAFWFWLALPFGALALLMIHNMTGGQWMASARLPLEAIAATMPLFILAFVPVLIGLQDLYPWSQTPSANHWYLNLRFFGIRAAIYFIVWNFFALWQLRPAATGPRSQVLSGIGLILLGYSVTWAAIDWIMSIEPDWFSSVYGMMAGSGEFFISLAFALVVITARRGALRIEDDLFCNHLASLATILIAVDIFWAYTAYSQWIIIWEENLRSEIGWYLERGTTLWRTAIAAIIVFDLIIPLFTLVWGPAKRRPRLVCAVAILLLLGGMIHSWWLVLPPFGDPGLVWRAPLAWLALGGVWLWLFLWRLERGGWVSINTKPHLTEAQS
ncbi:MAG TPA: hypothetical protein VG328_04220 [Stellaceae bacterium]|jgi:hypothetical protein|nr:hypothetical protein [Stellaceae bacterium]